MRRLRVFAGCFGCIGIARSRFLVSSSRASIVAVASSSVAGL